MKDSTHPDGTPESGPVDRAEQPGPTRWQRARAYLREHRYVTVAVAGLSAVALLLLVAVAAVLYLVSSGHYGEVPSDEALARISSPEASRVVDHRGRELGRYFIQERVSVERAALSEHLVHALVATEDARFYSHRGVDLEAWARVLYRTLIQGDEGSGGGSTLSQQLIKNVYGRSRVHDDPTVSLVLNKLREVICARRVERLLSKDEILALSSTPCPSPTRRCRRRRACCRTPA